MSLEKWRSLAAFLVLGLVSGARVLTGSTSTPGEVIYRESFDEGPAEQVWTTGKNKSHTEGETWHRNILGHYGWPAPLQWSRTGGRSGGYAYTESPWYFDDNHGEFMWFHLVFRSRGSDQAGIQGKDLRNAVVKFSIRGRNLDRKGTQLFFWIQGPAGRGGYYTGKGVYYNWALTSQPVDTALDDGQWHEVTLTLVNDERQWSQLGLINGGLRRKIRVIQSLTAADGYLDEILGGSHWNWGLLLCGVDPLDMPTGALDIDEFSIASAAAAGK